MKVLVIYATNTGSTYLMAEQIGAGLGSQHQVTLKDAKHVEASMLGEYSLVILGSPSWLVNNQEGQPHETILELMDALKNTDLGDRRFAIFGSGDSDFAQFCGAVDILERFVKEKGAKLVLPSLRMDGYYFKLNQKRAEVDAWTQKLLKDLSP